MFSIIAPIDTNRLEQFKVTKRIYDSMPHTKEFIMPTRSYEEVYEYFVKNRMMRNVRLMPYKHEVGFNPSKAFNMGVREAKYDRIIITSPEVKPLTDVLKQFEENPGNIVCQVWDEDESHERTSLVNKGFRSDNPGMYFLAVFNKEDIESINGWDEDFMKGYAYEDDDFGHRWVRAGLPFSVREDIQGVHQWHPRAETIRNGASINSELLVRNDSQRIIKCKNGLKML